MDPVLRHLIANARSEAVRVQFLQTPSAEYTTHQQVRLLTASYNVNGRAPPPGTDLREWLAVGGPHGEPDIVAVGFQELVPLNASNVVMGEMPTLPADRQSWHAGASMLHGAWHAGHDALLAYQRAAAAGLR